MIASTLRLATRDLGRNKRRTILSVLGVGIGCAIALLLTGFRESVTAIYSRMAGESGPGHLRVSPEGWLPRRDDALRLLEGKAVLEQVRRLEGVKVAAPRTRVQGLLAMGTRVAAVELTGVDPLAEPQAYRFIRRISAGRYLQPGDTDAVVIGQALAERLSVEVDDELVVTAVRSGGQMESALLRVVGLASSGSREIDSGVAHVPLATVENLSGLPGLGEIAVLLDDFDRLERVRAGLLSVAGPGNTVLRWSEISADLAQHLRQDAASSRLMSGIVIFVVLLGVAAAQLTAVLERKREFAVFAALGMRPWRLVVQIFVEALALGLLGAAAGALLAAVPLYLLITRGLDLSGLLRGGELTFEGTLMDPVIYAQLGWWMVPYLLVLSLVATVLGAIYPAFYAARTDPASALRSAA